MYKVHAECVSKAHVQRVSAEYMQCTQGWNRHDPRLDSIALLSVCEPLLYVAAYLPLISHRTVCNQKQIRHLSRTYRKSRTVR